MLQRGKRGAASRGTTTAAAAARHGLTSPPRKIVIQSFTAPQLPESFESDTWGKLRSAIAAIYGRVQVRESLEELYRGVEALCLYGRAAALHERLRLEVDLHVRAEHAALLRDGAGRDGERWLAAVSACWDRHCGNVSLIRNVFGYLDRTYALSAGAGVRGVWDVALAMFRDHVASSAAVLPRTVAAVLGVVESERRGDAVDRPLASSVVKMLSATGLYDDSLEPAILRDSSEFYHREGIEHMSTASAADVPEFLRRAESRLRDESDRCIHYLLPRTRKPLLAIAERELLHAHLRAILDRGLDAMLDQSRLDDLARLFALCSRIGATEDLRRAFAEHVKRVGRAIVMDTGRDKTMVSELLALKARLEKIVDGPFAASQPFATALREAAEAFINERPNKPAELIAKFVDRQLRAGSRAGSEGDDDVESLMDRVVSLFRMIHGKDVFEAFYKKYLAKRLLLGRSASVDSEKGVIAKLKTECGAAFTSKLEGMFKDIDISRNVMEQFNGEAALPSPGIDLNMYVLTSSFWPAYPALEITLPQELVELQQAFKTFYLRKNSSRKLTFQNTLGTVVLRSTFRLGKKELLLTLPQAVVLMAFNSVQSLAFRDLQAATGIDPKELRVLLLSFTTGKHRPLVKSTLQREISDDDVLSVNDSFSSKLFRLKISLFRPKEETAKEDTKTQETVIVDRQYQIDAAIVRIMKTRKHLSHPQLIAELFNQLKFPVSPLDLKKRIESLIDREYLERDKSDAQSYDYLA